jgi:hypothetical protein
MEGMTASQISTVKGKGELEWGGEQVELKTSRYDSHRVLAGWLGTWRVFLAFSARTRISALFIVPTDEPRQHRQVSQSLSCTHTVQTIAQNCSTIYGISF